MKHAKILDCTLRDGAYLVDKKFGDNVIAGIINGLMNAGIDIIEVGFLQDDEQGEGKTVYKNAEDARRFIPANKGRHMFTVLADYSRYSIENLDVYDKTSVDAVRACFFKKERHDVISFCRSIKEKGYKVFIQPVDILGYTDVELIDLVETVNTLEPYCFSIVDTFGSMYIEDLQRVYSLINHNLITTSRIGFHSHNNMQMSNALSQEFLKMSFGEREVIIDTTTSGMGRGAGNTPTELIAQYMVNKLGYCYDIDALLDLIDTYMENIKKNCSWGYSTSYFIAGNYSAHVNNIAYLVQKNSIRSKDIRYLLNKIGPETRKRYDYKLLEKTYLNYLQSDINDEAAISRLRAEMGHQNIVIIAPGQSVKRQCDRINKYICDKNAKVIAINFIPKLVDQCDYLYISNTKRYDYWTDSEKFRNMKKIITANIRAVHDDEKNIVVSFTKLIKCGWNHVDNSAMMLLRLIDMMNAASIAIAGLDGYEFDRAASNYAEDELEIAKPIENPAEINREISLMLRDYKETRTSSCKVGFLTETRFTSSGIEMV